MLTPIDIQNHTLKTAVRGYSKKETDEFLEQILAGYEELFKENHDLKEKVSSLSEGIQNYKQMETTLQKALVLAEKTSTETQEAAKSKADAMIREAQTKAEAIEKESEKKNLVSDILIEVNVACEESKFGLKTDEVEKLVRDVAKLPHLRVKGLMTIAPFVENAEENRNIFRELKALSVDIAVKNIDNISMDILSMGMTGDYEVAVEEGATLVRVGTGIFGERNYSI